MENASETSMNTAMKHDYYKHSGGVNPLGVIMVLAMGAVGTIILGLIYSYATCYIPFVYLNILLAIGFGLGVGALVGIGGTIGKIRNTFLIGLISVLFGLFAEYCQWVFWILAESKQEVFIINPVEIYYIIRYFAITGVWSIGSITPTGAVLYTIWFGEAAIIVGASALIAIYTIKTKPFCERCNEWVKKEDTLSLLNYVDDINGLKYRLEQGEFSALTGLGKVEKDISQYTKVTLKHCEQCKDFYLISVWAIKISKGRKDELRTESKEVVHHLLIDEKVYTYLMDWNRS